MFVFFIQFIKDYFKKVYIFENQVLKLDNHSACETAHSTSSPPQKPKSRIFAFSKYFDWQKLFAIRDIPVDRNHKSFGGICDFDPQLYNG